MAQHDPVDPLLDLDALLKQELSATPSPEFLPRVREAVRLEPEPTRWRGLWLLAPLAAAATLVVALAAGLLMREEVAPPTAPSAPVVAAAVNEPRTIPEPLVVPPPRVPSTHLRASPSALPVPADTSRYGGQAEPRAAEVLVDQRQRVALLTLLRMASDGRVTEESFKTTTPPPSEIGVDPVAVSPIVVGGVLPFETDRK